MWRYDRTICRFSAGWGGTTEPPSIRMRPHSGELFEYWGHEASLLPVDMFPLFRWRMDDAVVRPWRRVTALRDEHPGYIAKVENEIATRGPLTVSQLADPGERTGPWWGYGRGNVALAYLFAAGRISARRGKQFIRIYDLTERIIPADVYARRAPERSAAYRFLLELSARHHGIGTAGRPRRLLPAPHADGAPDPGGAGRRRRSCARRCARAGGGPPICTPMPFERRRCGVPHC